MQQLETRFQCDNCKRLTYNAGEGAKMPDGWHSIRMWPGRIEDEPSSGVQDLCDSCSQAVLQIMGKRKGIERGTSRDKPLKEHLKSPEACNEQSRVFASRMASTTTD